MEAEEKKRDDKNSIIWISLMFLPILGLGLMFGIENWKHNKKIEELKGIEIEISQAISYGRTDFSQRTACVVYSPDI